MFCHFTVVLDCRIPSCALILSLDSKLVKLWVWCLTIFIQKYEMWACLTSREGLLLVTTILCYALVFHVSHNDDVDGS